MDLHYLRVASLVFDCPVCLQQQKLASIIEGLSPRFLGEGKKSVASMEYEEEEEGPQRRPYQLTPEGVAVIPIMGTLVKRGDWMSSASGLTGYNRLQGQIEDAATDPKVKGIILDVDSCGGQVNGLFDLVDLVRAARENKPLWAVADDDCYSAAYAIASAAEKIYLTRTGGVGSVGVLAAHRDETQANAMEGISYTFFRSGQYKYEGNEDEPLSDHAAQTLQQRVDEMGLLLAQTVGKNRGMSAQAVLDMEAALFFGQYGIDAGLADQIGTLEQAHAEMVEAVRPVALGIGWARSAAGRATAEKQRLEAEESLAAEGAHVRLGGGREFHITPKGKTLVELEAEKSRSPRGVAAPLQEEETMTTQTQQAAARAPEGPPEEKLLSLDQARAEGEKSGEEKYRAYASEVNDLCALAGFTDQAQAFIDKKSPIAEVRRALLEARVQREEAVGVIQPQSLAASGGRVRATLDLPEYYRRLNARSVRPGAVM